MLPETSLLAYFADLEDPRNDHQCTHPLMNIIVIAILGVICGADNWVDIERYGKAKQGWLASFLDLSHGIPSHDTFGRVFRWLDPEAFQARFITWTQSLCQHTQGQLVSVDGKKLRRSHDRPHGREGIWMVNAWATANRLVLGQRQVEDKSNEITAIPPLLEALDITGCVVTIDAMGTQSAIAEAIVAADADYILAVKENQGTLYEDLEMLFEGFEDTEYADALYDDYKQVTEGHGRREIRHCWVVAHPDYWAYLRRASTWPRLTSLVKLITVRTIGTRTEITTRYFISSWRASARQFLQRIQAHWQIENGLHWVLDIAFREDEARLRKDHAPQNMAVLRHMATNLLKQDKSVKVGIAAKRKMAGWDNDYLFRVLCPD
ncbi:MAG: ISAs1 family transposase [Anaerolineae bacterium]|nr:ISAs1 family transposase [Anaerolineae bacterium]